MLIVDDPMLALIMRFVTDPNQPDEANDEFVKRQIQTLQGYVEQFPAPERGARAMEWIEQHARDYRRSWQRRKVSQITTRLRCADCPLKSRNAAEQCEIHEQWLYLLRRYVMGDIKSKRYIKDTMRLLGQHKKLLRHRLHPGKKPKATSRKWLKRTLTGQQATAKGKDRAAAGTESPDSPRQTAKPNEV